MPDQRYDAGRQTVGMLLSTTSPKLEVPEWQRSYSWGSDEIEAFWADLVAFDNAYPAQNIGNQEYFLGSAVLVTGGPTNLVLDGQQRLATATILLSALRDARRSYKSDAATRLQSKYIADFDDATGQTVPVLTLNVYDRAYFRAEVQDERAADGKRPKPSLKSHGLIQHARDYFAARVAEEQTRAGGGELGFKRNLRISEVVCDHMSLVVVSSTDEDNAASVFETLNDRGIGLSTPDLLRNHLLRRASGEDARDRIVTAWRAVLGVSEEASVDDFIRHYWISNRGDVKARKLYREIKDTLTEEETDPVEFSLAVAEEAPTYQDVARARDADPDTQRLLEGVRLLGAKMLFPAILSGYSALAEDGTKEPLRHLIAALTTLFVRHSVIGGRDSSPLESKVYSLAAELRANKDFDAVITSIRDLAPDQTDFVKRFKSATVTRLTTARYLLGEIEHVKRATAEVAVERADRVHMEHIYPQTPAGTKWPNHSQIINRLGNLTLLGKRLNTSIKNADFATKKEKGYKSSDIVMTKELLDYEEWTPATIDLRQDELSKWILKVWKFPGEEPLEEEQPDAVVVEEAVEVSPEALPEFPE